MTISRIGILGGGPLAEAFATTLARAEVGAVIGGAGWSRGSPAAVAAEPVAKASIATLKAAAEEDVVFLSVLWSELAETLAGIADWESRILIDATNRLPVAALPPVPAGKTSSEIVRDLAPGAQLVKAFNTLSPEVLASEPAEAGGRRVVFLAGDHLRAKVEIARLVARLGFAAIDVGGLVAGGSLLQCPDGPLFRRNLVSLDP